MTIKEIFESIAEKDGWESYDQVYYQSMFSTMFEYIERTCQEYARIKCLEAIRNTRYKSIEIINEHHHRVDTGNGEYDVIDLEFVTKDIQNIRNEDVLPEL